jgi:lysophospholipase L1-like esterase
VIALGTDFTINRRQIKRALHYLGPDRVLGLATPWELGGYAGKDARVMREAAKDYRKRIVLLDWVKFSRGHGRWFQPDGCHLTFAGARAFARLFKRALPFAQPPAPPAP